MVVGSWVSNLAGMASASSWHSVAELDILSLQVRSVAAAPSTSNSNPPSGGSIRPVVHGSRLASPSSFNHCTVFSTHVRLPIVVLRSSWKSPNCKMNSSFDSWNSWSSSPCLLDLGTSASTICMHFFLAISIPTESFTTFFSQPSMGLLQGAQEEAQRLQREVRQDVRSRRLGWDQVGPGLACPAHQEHRLCLQG